MQQVRKYFIAGKPGTGKSTLARMLMNKQVIDRHLVIEPDVLGDGWGPYGYDLLKPTPENLRTFEGKKRIVWDAKNKDLLADIYNNVFNSVITLDDCYFLMLGNKTYREVETILGRARQTGNHIFVTIHGASLIPAPFWTYPTDVIIMKTTDKPDRAAYKIPGFETLEKAVELVNRSENPRAFIHIKKS